ncbi:hypothetical protein T265_11074 [Opisthorchis viverrini]|uniref:Uncharacterized protein n=1 Tax=Opisthorchis viverrini TaxID=6198 RepID=A0A074YZY8_OPIVI|nr:hypothetical protein T265_11074 [Opisthorchis viverrini]KER20356.1 hypothetical protein T265_11074 [Opisthorchis viverrini]
MNTTRSRVVCIGGTDSESNMYNSVPDAGLTASNAKLLALTQLVFSAPFGLCFQIYLQLGFIDPGADDPYGF